MNSQDELAAYLKIFLTEWRPGKQTPRGIENAWRIYTENQTPVISYPGLRSFFAVYRGKLETANHHKNRKAKGWVDEKFRELSTEAVGQVLAQVEGTIPHPTIATILERIMTAYPPSRQQPAHVEHDPTLQAHSTAIESTRNVSEVTNLDFRENPSSLNDVDTTMNIMTSQLSAISVVAGQKFDNGCPRGFTKIYPPFICSAVRKMGSGDNIKVAATMIFPYQQDGSIHCLCSLSIIPSKLTIIAKEVLGVILDIEGGMVYVVSERGWKVLPRPTLTLQGAPEEGIHFLGPVATHAIETSPQRKDELNRSTIHTSSVTLHISHDPSEDGQLNLNFGLEAGLAIQALLYPDK